MNDEKLISLVQRHEELYNMADKKYNDNVHKEKLWKSIGNVLNKPAIQCKARWVSLRDQFRKAMKRKNIFAGQPGYIVKKWKYEDEMAFLFPYFRERPNHFSAGDDEDSSDDKKFINLDAFNDSPKEVQKETPKETPKYTESAGTSEIITCYVEEKRDNHAATSAPSNSTVNPIDAFFTGIIATVKQFSPYYQNIAKTKIFSIVSEIELKQILENQNQQYESTTQSPSIAPTEIKRENLSSSIVLPEENYDIFHEGEEAENDTELGLPPTSDQNCDHDRDHWSQKI